MSILTEIQGHNIELHDDGSVTFGPCKADIDGDGTGSSHGDPDYQDSTSLKFRGNSLNADTDSYIVVPPVIIEKTAGIVLGCQALVTYRGVTVPAVVGDIGPHAKLGEISIACAKALGIPSSPLSGGVTGGVSYLLRPGIPATVNGVTYDLQPSA